MTKVTKANQKTGKGIRATIMLEDEKLERFELILESIKVKIPGIKVDAGSVLAHALFLACEHLAEHLGETK